MRRPRLVIVSAIAAPTLIALNISALLYAAELPSKVQLQAMAEEQCLMRRGSNSALPPKAFRTDGCSLWPNGNWLQCCVRHDMDYWCGGSSAQRAASDLRLQQCVSAAGHPKTGAFMQFGVRLTASRLLPTPWRWGYGWPWLSNRARLNK